MPEQLRIRLGHVKHSSPIDILASDVQMFYGLSHHLFFRNSCTAINKPSKPTNKLKPGMPDSSSGNV